RRAVAHLAVEGIAGRLTPPDFGKRRWPLRVARVTDAVPGSPAGAQRRSNRRLNRRCSYTTRACPGGITTAIGPEPTMSLYRELPAAAQAAYAELYEQVQVAEASRSPAFLTGKVG